MIPEARSALLAWYDVHARDLPWRRTSDPYAIWVSEIMLQQTRVEAVIPYYERFLARFPTMESLARAEDDDVLAMWSGLGYYRRARFLKRGVSEAFAKYGAVPEDAEARRALPGVGAYTAGAIGSIAFGRPEPIVDGNVARVLSRVHRLDGVLGETSATKVLWARAAEWAEGPRPGDLNQALMELGATVCTPLEPRCDACPLARSCEALAHGETRVLPRVAKKAKPKPATWSVALARDEHGRIVVVRGTAELFGGLHGLPTVEGDREALLVELRRHAPAAELPDGPAFAVRHVLSHRALTVQVYLASVTRTAPETALRTPAELDSVGVSRLTRKILERTASSDATTDDPPRPARRRRARS